MPRNGQNKKLRGPVTFGAPVTRNFRRYLFEKYDPLSYVFYPCACRLGSIAVRTPSLAQERAERRFAADQVRVPPLRWSLSCGGTGELTDFLLNPESRPVFLIMTSMDATSSGSSTPCAA